jgi:hypothetical protein
MVRPLPADHSSSFLLLPPIAHHSQALHVMDHADGSRSGSFTRSTNFTE